MSVLGAITLGGIVIIGALVFLLLRVHSADMISDLVKKRQGSAKIVCAAEYVEGMEHIPVALALMDREIVYDNPDMQARLQLDQVDEIEYDDELATAQAVRHGKVLRVRSHGHTFEFIVPDSTVAGWTQLLPAHRLNDPVKAQTG